MVLKYAETNKRSVLPKISACKRKQRNSIKDFNYFKIINENPFYSSFYIQQFYVNPLKQRFCSYKDTFIINSYTTKTACIYPSVNCFKCMYPLSSAVNKS